MSVTTTFPPGLGSKTTIMDLAATAILPDSVPATISPLIKLIYGFLLKKGRIDITAAISKLALFAGAIYSLKTLWDFTHPIILSTLTTSITLPIEHQTAKDIQAWLSSQGSIGGSTKSAAQRHIKYTATGMVYNKSTQKFQLEGEKQTNIAGGWFWFKRQPLYFVYARVSSDQKQPQYVEANDHGSKQLSGDEITVHALGFSGVLEELVREVSVAQVVVKGTTVVFHVSDPNDDNVYRAGYFSEWMPQTRPSRPMSTIDLSAELKKSVLDDVTQFLEPAREKYYSDRGIPYSRKILAFGPPGTGKSSFALALAGMIRGALYSANMGEIRDEAHMRRLFQCPEKGDILLLEDIDCANIKREAMKGEGKKRKTKTKRRSRRRGFVEDSQPPPSPISLSGLLNAIDSIPDGVILLMTSNSPESLDKALVRPGRIDKQVLFGYISKAVAESIFVRMYQHDDGLPTSPEVAALATTFAKKIPELKLTPAEVQGYLIPRRDPLVAVAEADKWVADVLEAREKGLNIVGVKGDDAALGIKKKQKGKNKKKGGKKCLARKEKIVSKEAAEDGPVEPAGPVDDDDAEFFDAREEVESEPLAVVKTKKSRTRRRRSRSPDTDGSLSDTLIDGDSSESGSESEVCSDDDSGSDSDSGDSSNDSASEDESDSDDE
ncbi:P-loop containing nucleoside triphosphate hydrolase protein [Byssothecium circinans]|uniref:P-loop containing nucleoside triphosphate hydrolase protein n=1 Tax=Byssothecium circinans TaxID=147558 RepID=A0A6A5U7W8_9PLEO|nr:P-loop containing nucleoside triphosphate hydrolase protein [Byssothecium circinans]